MQKQSTKRILILAVAMVLLAVGVFVLLRSAETLLHNRAAVTEAVVIFDENGLCPDGAEPVAYDSLVTAVEADDLYFFTWGNQALLLFKQELQNQSPEAFSGWLAERTTLLSARDAP